MTTAPTIKCRDADCPQRTARPHYLADLSVTHHIATIRTLQAELFRAVGDDIASLRNRIKKTSNIGVREKSFRDPATRA